MPDVKINYDFYINKYEDTFKGQICKRLKMVQLPVPFQLCDVQQECRIHLWKLLAKKYDPNIGNIDNFIRCSIPFIVKNVLYRIVSSHNVTGTVRSKRTRKAKLHKDMVSFIDDAEEMYNEDSPDYTLDDYFIDLHIIDEVMRKSLSESSYKTFNLIFIKGLDNRGAAIVLRKSVSSISGQLKTHIIPVLMLVLDQLGYYDE